jgi:hypothetical protein
LKRSERCPFASPSRCATFTRPRNACAKAYTIHSCVSLYLSSAYTRKCESAPGNEAGSSDYAGTKAHRTSLASRRRGDRYSSQMRERRGSRSRVGAVGHAPRVSQHFLHGTVGEGDDSAGALPQPDRRRVAVGALRAAIEVGMHVCKG